MNASTGMSSPLSSTTPGGFAGDVFGQQPHEIDRVLSRLIQDNYDVADARRGEPSPETGLPGTWARMNDAAVRAAGIDPALLHDAMSGFGASLYRDAGGAVVVADAGSAEWQDDGQSGVSGTSVSVRGGLGGRRSIKTKNIYIGGS